MKTPLVMAKRSAQRQFVTAGLFLCVGVGITALVFFSHRAAIDSQRSARQLLEHRSTEQLALLWAALGQDMRGAQNKVLMAVTVQQLQSLQTFEWAELFARGFARFPYPESFFVWKPSPDERGLTTAFNRAQRPPPWNATGRSPSPYPVEAVFNASVFEPLVAHAREVVHDDDWPVVVFETQIERVPYQIIIRPIFDAASAAVQGHDRVVGLVGFTVNLDWVRRFYFQELAHQVSRIGGDADDVSLAILDERGANVVETQPGLADTAAGSRQFPLVFADREILQIMQPSDVHFWSARAAGGRGSRWATTVDRPGVSVTSLSIAALIAAVGLIATVRGTWAAAELASMKADFVSSVTHDLKTPLATIQLISDTLKRGHYDSHDAVRRVATLLEQECRSFSLLVDNLLTCGKLDDSDASHMFGAVDVHELLEDALEEFRPILIEREFDVRVDVPDDLPAVQGDRSALLQVLRNLVDNAIKYSDQQRVLEVGGYSERGVVIIRVADRGRGIPTDEIARVCEKFFRGRNAKARGSGLGLAIVRRIVDAHHGLLNVESLSQGTRVDVQLPIA